MDRMKLRYLIVCLMIIVTLTSVTILTAVTKPRKPVTPNALHEAKALLEFFYDISGKHMLTGQHNYPNTRDKNSQFAASYIGKTPVIYSQDWGHAGEGDTDSYLARPDIVDEAIRQHKNGAIVTICWHAVPPTADEPVTFRPIPGKAAPESLMSVQGSLLDQQFRDVLTPGTELYNRWCAQVDTIAVYLKKLRDAHVPVLWRPYHEMNGNWFWWGGRRGEFSTVALYRQMFDRYVKIHKLTNLIWEWSVDRPLRPDMQYADYFPGLEYMDILALDVYEGDFNQRYYDQLVALAEGKPVVLGEVGTPPTPEIIQKQPLWSYYVVWAGMVRNMTKKQYELLVNDSYVLFMEDSAYQHVSASYRKTCKLTPNSMAEAKIFPALKITDFSGAWEFNEDASTLDRRGAANVPYQMRILQQGNDLSLNKTFIVEYADNRSTEENLTLDGQEIKSETRNSPTITTATWSATNDTLHIQSKATFDRGGQKTEMVTHEYWTIVNGGRMLSIYQVSTSFRGERKITLVYDRMCQ
jgi:mannan endo-1,4-beta-mannosidase